MKCVTQLLGRVRVFLFIRNICSNTPMNIHSFEILVECRCRCGEGGRAVVRDYIT